MYLTVKETAEYLSMPENKISALVLQGRIRAVHDGREYLINSAQFTTHFEQVEKYRQMILEYLNEPIPEDFDAHDED